MLNAELGELVMDRGTLADQVVLGTDISADCLKAFDVSNVARDLAGGKVLAHLARTIWFSVPF